MPQVLGNATRLWELKLSVSIPFNPVTSTSGSLFKGDNLQYEKIFAHRCSLVSVHSTYIYKAQAQNQAEC